MRTTNRGAQIAASRRQARLGLVTGQRNQLAVKLITHNCYKIAKQHQPPRRQISSSARERQSRIALEQKRRQLEQQCVQGTEVSQLKASDRKALSSGVACNGAPMRGVNQAVECQNGSPLSAERQRYRASEQKASEQRNAEAARRRSSKE